MLTGQVIYAILSADPTVGPLVMDPTSAGLDVNTYRISPLAVPSSDDVYPLIAYEGDEVSRDMALSGPTGFATQTVRVVCMATDYDDANALGAAVTAAMNFQSGTFGGVTVDRVLYRGESEEEDSLAGAGQDSTVYQKVVEFMVAFYTS